MKNRRLEIGREKYQFEKYNKRKALIFKYNGITLISLVITIIVLLILSSVAIYLSLGNNGIFTRAKQAKEETNKQEATDIINLKITTAQMNKYAEKQEMPTLQELADALYEDDEIKYVALQSQVADKEKIIVGDKTSIFTKLEQYPYEFEINSSLQLASINGVKMVADTTPTIQAGKYIHYKGLGGNTEDTYTFTEPYSKVYIFVSVSDNVNGRYPSCSIVSGDGTVSIIASQICGGRDNYYLGWRLYELTDVTTETTIKIGNRATGYATAYCIFI